MLLDQKKNINYDYCIMDGPGRAETGGPSADKARVAETQRVAREASIRESRRKLADPSLPQGQREQLQFGVSLYDVKSPQVPDIPKKTPDLPGTDLHPPIEAFDQATFADDTPVAFKDADGNPIKIEDMRVSAIHGADENGDLIVTFKDAKDNDVVDNTGKKFAFSLTRDEMFSMQVAAEPIYEDIAPDKAKEVVKTARESALADRGKGPAVTQMPADDALQAVKDEYGIADPQSSEPDQGQQEAEQEPQTPIEKADAIIKDHIAQLEAKLKDPEFKDKKEREKTQKLLFTLKVSATAKGPSSVILKSFALQQLNDSGAGDFLTEISDLASDEMQARVDIKYLIEDAKADPDSGIKSDRDVDELQAMIDAGDIMKLLDDKRVKKLSKLTQEIFGNIKVDLKQLLKDSNIPPEIQKELEKADADGESSGDRSKLWWLLIALIGAPVLVGGGLGLGGMSMVGQVAKGQ